MTATPENASSTWREREREPSTVYDGAVVRHTLAEATYIIVGDDGSGLTDPEGFVARKLRSGRFPGLKIGRNWFMTDADIESAIQTCRRGKSPAPEVPVESVPTAAPSVIDGLSERARRLRGCV